MFMILVTSPEAKFLFPFLGPGLWTGTWPGLVNLLWLGVTYMDNLKDRFSSTVVTEAVSEMCSR